MTDLYARYPMMVRNPLAAHVAEAAERYMMFSPEFEFRPDGVTVRTHHHRVRRIDWGIGESGEVVITVDPPFPTQRER